MNTILLFIIWTWGLTPVWVNIIVTIICAFRILLDVAIMLED